MEIEILQLEMNRLGLLYFKDMIRKAFIKEDINGKENKQTAN